MKNTKMLKKNYEFNYVFSKGTYYSGKVIEAFILDNRKEINFLGLAISSKAGHAYQRNRVKRLLRENYRLIENNIITGRSIVFLLKKKVNIQDVGYYEVKKDMQGILCKAKMLKNDNSIVY